MSILYPGKMSEEQDKRGAGGGKWRSGGTDRGMQIPSQESYSFMKDYLVKMGRSQKRIERLLGNAVISPQMEAYDNIKKFFITDRIKQ